MNDGRRPGPQGDREGALRAVAESLSAGRDQEALDGAQAVLQAAPGDIAALHLAGVALTRLGRTVEAVEALRRAVRAAPNLVPCQHALADALQKSGDVRGALAILHASVTRDPMDFEANQRLVNWIAQDVKRETRNVPIVPAEVSTMASPWRRVSIGFCTIDPVREAKARHALEAALAPAQCQFHVVRDPPSLAAGFNRVLDEVDGDLVILCHDDIEPLIPRLDLALHRALESADITGVAGATHVGGPAVLWSGHPHVHGWVTYPRGEELEVAPLSMRSGIVPGIESLDGVFMAMRGETARGLRFDAETFDGFHFYDLDFTYRAHLAGLRLCVTTEALLLHASEGSFGDTWRHYAERFMGKFPGLREPQGKPHWYGARLPSRGHAAAFYDTLRALDQASARNGPPA